MRTGNNNQQAEAPEGRMRSLYQHEAFTRSRDLKPVQLF